MIGTHAIMQNQCPVCFGNFMHHDELIMRVVDIGANQSTGSPAGVMVEYLHVQCRKEARDVRD